MGPIRFPLLGVLYPLLFLDVTILDVLHFHGECCG